MTDKPNGHAPEESLIPFPSDFIVKIMGKTEGDFEKNAMEIVQKHFPNVDLARIQKKGSKDNRYLSLSVTVFAESKAQLDALYRDLTSEKTVVMAL